MNAKRDQTAVAHDRRNRGALNVSLQPIFTLSEPAFRASERSKTPGACIHLPFAAVRTVSFYREKSMCISATEASAAPSIRVLPVAQLRHLYELEISSATRDRAPVNSNILENVAEKKSSSTKQEPKSIHTASKELSADIVQLIIEETVRLAPGKMPEQLAALRGVNKLFQDLADKTELQAKDIAYASTAKKTLNILRCDEQERRRPTLEALYGIWPHIEMPLSRIISSRAVFAVKV